jgi:hypothetical protein
VDTAGSLERRPGPANGDAAPHPPSRLFRAAAAGALALHGALLLSRDGIVGGADLRPHLNLIEQLSVEPALRSVYAPAYHVVGALLAPLIGLAAFTKLFAFGAAAALIAGFRRFQLAAGLPDACSALFAFAPYTFALTWCIPKVEAAGYAVALLGLSYVFEKRRLAAALALCATFMVHTAAGLVFGLCGGVLALARRDARALAALAGGTAMALPLFAAHLAAGCSLGESFLFSQGDYLRASAGSGDLARWSRISVLAGPIPVVAAVAGAAALWRGFRPLAVVCGLLVVLYLNELWLRPFGTGSTLDLIRGLSLLAIATAIAGGVALDAHPRIVAPVILASAVFALASSLLVVPDSCYTRTFSIEEIRYTTVERCRFRWRSADAGAAQSRIVASP